MTFKERISQLLVKLIKVSVFFILFLPLVMNSRFFFPFIVPKNVFFRIAVEIIFGAYLALVHLDPRYKPKFSKIVWSVLAFLGIAAVAGLVGLNIGTSFWGNYERMSGLFHLLHLVLYFFVLVNVFKEKKDWHSLLTFSIFAAVIMSFLAFAQWLQVPFLLKSSGGNRLSGTVGNPTFLAAYLIFNLFFILYFWAKEKRFDFKLFSLSFLTLDSFLVLAAILYKLSPSQDWGNLNIFKTPVLNEAIKYPNFFYPFLVFQILILAIWLLRSRKNSVKALLSVIFIFEFIIFYQTQTRGALIGFALGIAILLFVSLFSSVSRKIKLVSIVSLLLILSSPVILVLNKDSEFVKNNHTLRRLATISYKDVTTESRLLTWQASWRGWTESPKSFLIGYGPENYYYAFNKYFPVKIYRDPGSQVWFDRAHNIIFDTGVTTGIIGLISYLSILGFAVTALVGKYRKTKEISSSWLLVSLLVAYFGQNFFVFDTLNTEIPFYLSLGFVVFLTGQKEEVSAEDEKLLTSKDINYIYLSILLIILLFFIFAVNIRTLKANNYIFQALVLQDNSLSGVKGAFEDFKKAINESLVGRLEARQQLANYVNGASKNKDLPTQQISEMINYTTDELKKSVEEEPLNIRQYLFLSTFYNATTQYNRDNPSKVINLLSGVINLSPTRPQVYYEIAQAYAFQSNFEKAEEYFEKGANLAPWVIEDQWNLLTVYIVFEKYDLADAQFRHMTEDLNWQPKADDYKRIVNLYGRIKNYPKMIEFQQKVADLEQSAESYAQLAAIYAKIGENQKAREATKKAVEINPNFSAEAESFLKLLEAGKLLEK